MAKTTHAPLPGTAENPRVAREIYKTTVGGFIAQKLVPYMVYTVTDRAVPSAVDGLKKGQRRLMYSAYDAGITPDAKPRKSARIISDATGKYHPHGQTSMYDTLSTLARPYNRVAIIQGHGSFGMNPGDPAASERYTEARLSDAGMELVRDMKDQPVTMLRTYDGTNLEPEFLPARFPAALLIGTSGVSSGFSVTIPSHNPVELLTLCRALLKNPDLTTTEMVEIMPGPDWGTGARVIGSGKEIEKYYDTGMGKLTVQSVLKEIDGNVVLTECAPGKGLRTILSQVRSMIRAGELTTLSGADDHSDMDKGTHVVFTLRRGKKPADAIAELYAKTPLQTTFAVQMVFTDHNNVPRTQGMREVIKQFLALRDGVMVQRSTKAKQAAEKKLIRATALAAIVVDKQKAVELISNSQDRAAAMVAIAGHFELNEEQAEYVTSLPLYRLTKADEIAAHKEVADLSKEIARLTKLINSPAMRKKELDKELAESVKIFEKDGEYDRLTIIDNTAHAVEGADDDIPDEQRLESWSLDPDIGLLSDQGTKIGKGNIVWAAFTDGRVKLFAGGGLPKRVVPTPIAPDVADMVACGTLTPGKHRVMLVSGEGKIIAIDTGEDSKLRPQGKAGNGVAGMKLPDGVTVVAGFAAGDDDMVFTQSVDGWKVTPSADIPTKGRGGGGVMVHKLRGGDPAVTIAMAAPKFTDNGTELKPTPRPKATQRGTVDLDQLRDLL